MFADEAAFRAGVRQPFARQRFIGNAITIEQAVQLPQLRRIQWASGAHVEIDRHTNQKPSQGGTDSGSGNQSFGAPPTQQGCSSMAGKNSISCSFRLVKCGASSET